LLMTRFILIATAFILMMPATAAGPRLNQIQIIGTHNSYHVKPEEPFYSQIKAAYPDAITWDYSHAPLDKQLDRGVRSFELDVYHHPDGTRVLHVPRFDPGTTCERFVECLEVVRGWSQGHPRHVPVILLVELKDEEVPLLQESILPFDEKALDQLDAEIRGVFNADELLEPDDVRGDAPSLSDAVRSHGWPAIDDVRGQVMFVLHARGIHAERYTAKSPSLEGRAMFLESQEGQPYAAFFIRNDPRDENIAKLLEQGYLVRTRADSGLKQGAEGDPRRRDAAFVSGAQVIHTDFPPGEAHADTGYVVSFESGAARCNPVTSGADCHDVSEE
jgi:calcium-dependent phosphoinositide phospholipase C